jgi:hypothetical protein
MVDVVAQQADHGPCRFAIESKIAIPMIMQMLHATGDSGGAPFPGLFPYLTVRSIRERSEPLKLHNEKL